MRIFLFLRNFENKKIPLARNLKTKVFSIDRTALVVHYYSDFLEKSKEKIGLQMSFKIL